MEIKQRMSTRFGWLLGVVALVSIGLLVACGTTYNASSDGLVLIGSQGSAAIQTFTFNLGSGHISSVYNSTDATVADTCLLPGIPSSMILDPAGTYAYAILTANDACKGSTTGIQAFKVNSSGSLTAVGSIADPNPIALAIDSAGKFLFVAEGLGGGGVESFAIGSGGSLTQVAPTFTPLTPFQVPNFSALAVTPTVFPAIGLSGVQNAVCSGPGNNPPTSEYLYVADSVNDVVWEFGVDMSTGALTNPGISTSVPSFATGSVPSGVAVDPCDRFVYVANYQSDNVSGYTICNGLSTQDPNNCPVVPDDSLWPIAGSPFSLTGSTFPGPMVMDPYGNTVYVLDGSGAVSILRVATVSGSLTAGSPATVATGANPKSIAIRSDDSWLFVTNFTAGTLSYYSVTPASGSLTPQLAITTDNYPWGVAVK
jgi:6-phosphogluconolactonase (cycloisomerase 2 family)